MNKWSIRPNETLFRFVGIPFIAIMSHVVFFNENSGPSDNAFKPWQVMLIAIAEAMVLWEGNRVVLFYFRRRFPSLKQSLKRIVLQITGCLVVTIFIRYINVWLYSKSLFWGYAFSTEAYLYNIYVGLLYVAIVAGVYESIYYFQQWKKLFSESETLKRKNLESQLEVLKAQINPHFLFNNLSSLASLIMEDQVRAVKFVHELSAVYRYLLQATEKDLITLQEELSFCINYFKLLKTRFGEGIDLSIDINLDSKRRMLPPLTLQILIENAVKHNSTLPENPLLIKIFDQDGAKLCVENNRIQKHAPIISNSMGLKNIQRKYALLYSSEAEIVETPTNFLVTVPLILSNHEDSDHRR